MKGVVLAGGTGTRMFPLTQVTNKHLLPVYNEPMIFKVLKTLKHSGITEIMIVLGGESVGDLVRLLGSGKEFDISLTYRYQDQAGGIAEALSLTEDFVAGDNVAVVLGDNIFEDTFPNEVSSFENDENFDCYLFLKDVPDPERFGVALLEGDKIVSIEEKPIEPKSNYAITGIYFYKSNVFEKIKKVKEDIGYSKRNELEITDVNSLYVEGGKTKAFFLEGFWSDAGKFSTLLRSSNFIGEKYLK